MEKEIIVANSREHLKKIIEKEIIIYGTECDLNHIDVSGIQSMEKIFFKSKFNGDISQWNVSNVNNMSQMFFNSIFNGDIKQWNVSNVTDMSGMFFGASLNQDLSQWKPIKVKNISDIFTYCKSPIPYWAQIDDLEKRIIAIRSFELEKFFKKNLENKIPNKYKVKI